MRPSGIDRGALRNREDIGDLERPIGVVAEGLLDPRGGHLVIDLDVDLVVEHGQRRQLLLRRNQQARGADRGGGEKDNAQSD